MPRFLETKLLVTNRTGLNQAEGRTSRSQLRSHTSSLGTNLAGEAPAEQRLSANEECFHPGNLYPCVQFKQNQLKNKPAATASEAVQGALDHEGCPPPLALHARISPLPPSSLVVGGAPDQSTFGSPVRLADASLMVGGAPTKTHSARPPGSPNPAHTRAVPRRPSPSFFCGEP